MHTLYSIILIEIPDVQIRQCYECQWDMSMNGYKNVPQLAMLILVILIVMLLNFNTDYANTDVDLCIRIMSLCCNLLNISECQFIQTCYWCKSLIPSYPDDNFPTFAAIIVYNGALHIVRITTFLVYSFTLRYVSVQKYQYIARSHSLDFS